MTFRDEVKLFEKLSGESANDVSIERIGSFLDGYYVGKNNSVVHAHWVEFENPNYSPFDNSPEKIVLCSYCGIGHGTKDNYCCVCGAKMDEEVYDE